MMSVFEVPTFTDPSNYRQQIELDGVVFELSFNFNSRDNRWYLDILDVAGVQLRSSMRLVTSMALMLRWKELTRPAGELGMIDPSSQDLEATLDDIGVAVFLTYVDAAELAGE